MLEPRGRPPAEHPKKRIDIRLSHGVVECFKSAGEGWQSRIDTALRQFITERQGRQAIAQAQKTTHSGHY